ncbi:MAG: phospholipase D-like domain-containing protein [Bacteroidota bacterium]
MKSILIKLLLPTVFLLIGAEQLIAQTNPVPYDLSTGTYTFTNWPSASAAGTYPPNMIFHRGAVVDPLLSTATTADYTGSYSGTSGARMNGLGTDGFSWRNTSTGGDLGAAVLALNTTGISNIAISWTGGTVAVDATTREYRIRLQYRVGTSNAWTDVPGPIEYTVNPTAGHSQNFGPTLLPATVNNQPVVQLRWRYYYNSAGSNTRPQLRVGNITVQTGEASGNGTGSVRLDPDTLNGGVTGPINFIYNRDTSFTVNGLKIVIPPEFSWSQNAGDVSLTNITADKVVNGDTITISNIVFDVDSTIITVANVTSPNTTGYFPFKIQSKQDGYADVMPLQRIVVFGAPVSIAEAKANDVNGVMLNLNKLITVRGIVTVANQFNGPSFIQDNTGGIGIFGSAFSTAVNLGDEVVVSGLVQPFNGLSEIVNPVLHSIVSTGNVIDPLVVNASQIANDGTGGEEIFEGTLVRLNGITVGGSGNWVGNTNYPISDATGSTEIRIPIATNLVGSPVPSGAVDLIAVVGQFKNAPPYIGGYQLMPRSKEDIISTGPIIESLPTETVIQPTSLTIGWHTVNAGTSRLYYGKTPAFEEGIVAPDNAEGTTHTITLNDLTPATTYYIKAFSASGTDTSFAATLISSTSSSNSTGQTNVYFNYSVNTTLARGENAQTLGSGIVNKLINRINAANYSIDAALYSLSGTVGANVAAALVSAKNRGVKVRVIGENDNSGTAPWSTLSGASIPLIFDNYDAINAGNGFMHNKFVVIDNRNAALSDTMDWIWTGSWNLTDPGTNGDAQNIIEIQDRALANAFTMEFNEMWGSATESPNASASRFGARKTDNTPHHFIINGTPVELFFSPSDRTTSQIIRTVNKAAVSIDIALLSFTRTDISTAIINRAKAGVKVHALADVKSDSWSVFDALASNGVDMRVKGSDVTGSLHHKYGIIDAEISFGTPYVITGSHNWSSNAENSNNENTLIIQSPRIANLYLQEFGARYANAGGTDVLLNVKNTNTLRPTEYELGQNYPNPFNPATTISFSTKDAGFVSLKIYDVIGREVSTLVEQHLSSGSYAVEWNAAQFSSDIYFYQLRAGDFVSAKKMVLQK